MLAPHEFELPRFVKGGWHIGRFEYGENPRYTVPKRLLRLVERWRDIRVLRAGPGGMGSNVVLPMAGGYFDQPAAIMDAFQFLDGWVAERQRQGD